MLNNVKVPRRVKSQQVKEKIFNAAQKLLLEKGYEYLTVNNICLTAEVSAGSFYHHFTGKDELLAYYFTAGYEKYRKQFEAISGDDIIKNIVAAYELYLTFCKEQSIGFMKMFYTPVNKSLRTKLPEDGGTATPHNLPVLAKSIELFKKAQTGGYLSQKVSEKELGYEVCIMVKGCVFDWCLNDGNTDLSGITQKMLTRHLCGVVTDKYRKKFKI